MRLLEIAWLLLLCCFSLRAGTGGESAPADSIQFLIQQNRFHEAARLAATAIGQHPEKARLHYLAGLAWQGQFRPLKALTYFQRAEQLEPKNSRFRFALARIYYQLSRYREAAKLFKKILTEEPDNQIARLWLADCQFTLQRYQEALAIYQPLTEQDSLNLFALQRTALCLQRLRKTSRALTYWKKLATLDPGNAQAAAALANFFLSRNRLDSAGTVLTTALSYDPHNRTLLRLQAQAVYRHQSYRQASRVYRHLLSLGDSTSFVFRRLGICQLYLDSLSAAEQYLQQAVRQDSTEALSWFYLGLVYNELKDYSKAITALEKAIRLSQPDFLADAFAQLATAYQATGRHGQAIQAFKQALKLDASRSVLWFYLASAYDTYYADRRVPLLYYRKFLQADTTADPTLQEYARYRIEKLRETIHFHQYRRRSPGTGQDVEQGG